MAGRKARSERDHEPVSSDRQPDTVPSRSLPPLAAFDRRSDGEPLGQCPNCGRSRWWDNRAAKRAAQTSAKAPDFTCAECRAGHWESDPPNPARSTSTTVLPPTPAIADQGSSRQCVAVKANGERCGGAAMQGSDRCGPHSDPGGGAPSNQCQGVTKAGKPCRAGAPKGQRYCPAHASQAG